MQQVRLGLERGLEPYQVAYYANIKFNWKQMQEIRTALEQHLDVKDMLDPKLSYQAMKAKKKEKLGRRV